MVDFLLTSAVIFVVLTGWLYVQHVYRQFAARHPELGPFRREEGCGGGCSCSKGSCSAPPAGGKPEIKLQPFPEVARIMDNKEKQR